MANPAALGTVRRTERHRGLAYHGLPERYRRPVAAVLAACAVGTTLLALAPPAPPSRAVLAAARDLPAGAALAAADVTVVRMPPDLAPDGALQPGQKLDGLLVAGPIGRGEVLTDLRFVGSDLLTALAEDAGTLVAAPVRLADPGVARLLLPGQLVDVLAAHSTTYDQLAGAGQAVSAWSEPARVVAARVRVLSVAQPDADDMLGGTVGAEGPLVVLATTAETAAVLAGAAATAQLSVVILAD